MEKMKRFKRRLSQTLRGSHTIDESLSELAEQMTIEENGLKDSGEFSASVLNVDVCVGRVHIRMVVFFTFASSNLSIL